MVDGYTLPEILILSVQQRVRITWVTPDGAERTAEGWVHLPFRRRADAGGVVHLLRDPADPTDFARIRLSDIKWVYDCAEGDTVWERTP
jgi:hypothetical protein